MNEGVRTADSELVYLNLMLEEAKGRATQALLLGGNTAQLAIALNDEEIYKSRLKGRQKILGREREYQKMVETSQRRKELERIRL